MSAALCSYATHPRERRRYLVVAEPRSSRICLVDSEPDPAAPETVRIIELT